MPAFPGQASWEGNGDIRGSFHATRGMNAFRVDPDSPCFEGVFRQDKRVAAHCTSGLWSALPVATRQDLEFAAAHGKDRFSDWVVQGRPLTKDA